VIGIQQEGKVHNVKPANYPLGMHVMGVVKVGRHIFGHSSVPNTSTLRRSARSHGRHVSKMQCRERVNHQQMAMHMANVPFFQAAQPVKRAYACRFLHTRRFRGTQHVGETCRRKQVTAACECRVQNIGTRYS
jgi:hypothetical protein